jgi:hypothetical protein
MGAREFLKFKLHNRITCLVYVEEINQFSRMCYHFAKIQIARHQIIYQTRPYKYCKRRNLKGTKATILDNEKKTNRCSLKSAK